MATASGSASARAYPARQPIYNAQRTERNRGATEALKNSADDVRSSSRQAANDNSVNKRVERPTRGYTDYELANDNAPGRSTVADDFTAAAAARTDRSQGLTIEEPTQQETDARHSRDRRMRMKHRRSYQPQEAEAVVAETAQPVQITRRQQTRAERIAIVAQKKRQRLVHRTGVRFLGIVIQPCVWTYYAAVQLPFALLTTILLLIAYAFHGVVGAFTDPATWYGRLFNNTIGRAADAAADWVNWFAGFDLVTLLDPLVLAMIVLALTGVIGLLVILTLLTVYWIAGHVIPNPYGGGPAVAPVIGTRGTVFKFFAFVFAVVGTMAPLMNLLPLIPIWTLVVWRFPR